MPRGVRGSKKPSITRRSRQPAAPEAASDTSADISPMDLALEHLRGIHVAMNAVAELVNESIVPLMKERNDIVKEATPPGEGSIDVEQIAGLESRLAKLLNENISPLVKRIEAVEKLAAEKKERKPREAAPGSVVMTAGTHTTTPVELAKPAPKSEVVICKHIRTETLRPGLERCLDCGAVIDVPVKETPPAPVPAAQAVPVKANPAAETAAQITAANGKIPTADDVRAVAITYAGKHGKPALADALKEFGATNLSTLPEENRAGLMAKLQAGI